MIAATLVLPDVDHAAADETIAKNTDAVVVKGIPFPMRVTFLEDR
jgi:hypothetical protein